MSFWREICIVRVLQPKNIAMSNREDNLLYRIKAVQTLDRMYYRKGKHYYSHHRVWQNHASRIFGINYTTYASYLRQDVSQLPELQETVIDTVRMLDRLLNGPLRLSDTEPVG